MLDCFTHLKHKRVSVHHIIELHFIHGSEKAQACAGAEQKDDVQNGERGTCDPAVKDGMRDDVQGIILKRQFIWIFHDTLVSYFTKDKTHIRSSYDRGYIFWFSHTPTVIWTLFMFSQDYFKTHFMEKWNIHTDILSNISWCRSEGQSYTLERRERQNVRVRVNCPF